MTLNSRKVIVMNKNRHGSHLLVVLNGLYKKVSMRLAAARIRAGRLFVHKPPSIDINSILLVRIEELASAPKNEVGFNNRAEVKILDKDVKPSGVRKTDTVYEKNIYLSECMATEFSRHVSNNKRLHAGHSGVADKLKASVWEHLNASVRCARNNDMESAKLHANITSRALEEAGHYMDAENYARFALDIEKYFDDSKREDRDDAGNI